MRVEVHCPDCKSTWQVDGSATGEMLCPSCMTRIPLGRAPEVRLIEEADPEEQAEPTAVSPEPGTPAGDAMDAVPATSTSPGAAAPVSGGLDDLQPTVRDMQPTQDESDRPERPAASGCAQDAIPTEAAEAPAPASGRTQEQVVCPRCHLHFRPSERPVDRSGERKTILVVDDLAYFRQIAEDALQHAFDVKTVATSAEARELMAGGGIDLLVLDLTLDGCNAGRDLLVELQPKPCPILIFTAQDESEMYGEGWEELKRLGADDLVIKGMKVAESLARKASTLLGTPTDDED